MRRIVSIREDKEGRSTVYQESGTGVTLFGDLLIQPETVASLELHVEGHVVLKIPVQAPWGEMVSTSRGLTCVISAKVFCPGEEECTS